jgi:hypothetical protein
VPVDIVAGLGGARPAEVIGEVLRGRHLVEVTEQAVHAHVQRAVIGANDVES